MRNALLIFLLHLLTVDPIQSFSTYSITSTFFTSCQQHRKVRGVLSASRDTADISIPTDEQYSAVLASLKKTVAFKGDLMNLEYGEHVKSETLSVASDQGDFDFRIKFYPRGGGQDPSIKSSISGSQKSGFGMSYKSLPMFGKRNEKVGAYLQYIPRQGSNNVESIDATFGMTLIGEQQSGPRFNIEWKAGMRFVPLEDSSLAQGRANDFGASFMQTTLLDGFMGFDEYGVDAQKPLKMNVEIQIHHVNTKNVSSLESMRPSAFARGLLPSDIREVEGGPEQHSAQVRVGKIIVPVLTSLSQRAEMFSQGAYPGVEYRILRIVDPRTQEDLFFSRPGVDYYLKPIYPLVSQLERPWPVIVNEAEIPKVLTPNMYNFISAIGSLATAISGLLAAFVVSQAVSFFVIPSLSMDPTLQKGDVLLVDKVTPRVLPEVVSQPGNVVFFHPPEGLRDIVSRNGGRINERDLFVKRVAATYGDTLTVTNSEGAVTINGQTTGARRDLCEAEPLGLIRQYITPNSEIRVNRNEVAVLGDCSSVSIDSRVWGPLPQSDIVGRPLVRLWPLDRFGGISDLPPATENEVR